MGTIKPLPKPIPDPLEVAASTITITSLDDLVAQLQLANDRLEQIYRSSKYTHHYPLFFSRLERDDADLKAVADELVSSGKATRKDLRMKGFGTTMAKVALADVKGTLAAAKELVTVPLSKKLG